MDDKGETLIADIEALVPLSKYGIDMERWANMWKMHRLILYSSSNLLSHAPFPITVRNGNIDDLKFIDLAKLSEEEIEDFKKSWQI